MNTAFLLMSTAWIAGSDPAGCAGCVGPVPVAASCDSCGTSSPGLFARLRGKLSCGAACGTPLYTAPAACDSCGGSSSPGLLAKLKARFHHSKDCAAPCGAAPCATGDCGGGCGAAGAGVTGGCALPAAPGTVMPVPAAESPKEMPKAKEMPTPKVEPKKIGVEVPSVSAPAAPF